MTAFIFYAGLLALAAALLPAAQWAIDEIEAWMHLGRPA